MWQFCRSHRQLIYATADAGKEFLANKALALSDTVSTQILEFLSRLGPDQAEDWPAVDDVETCSPSHL